MGGGFQTTAVLSADKANVTFTITFRRDPAATDLTYLLQTSGDLVNWTTITQSTAGGFPSGTGFVSESDDPVDAPVKRVVAHEVLPAPVNRYARLMVIRMP
jgi:hypothetical protein